MENRTTNWCSGLLSLGSRLTLVKSILEATAVYWHSLAYIPMGILEKIKKRCFQFLWKGGKNIGGLPLVKWKRLAKPKAMGGWGMKNIHQFVKALAAKNL